MDSITNGESFYVYDWRVVSTEKDTNYFDRSGNRKKWTEITLMLRAYCVDANGATVCLRMGQVKTKLYVEFPENYDLNPRRWSAIRTILKDAIYCKNDKCDSNIQRVSLQPLYGAKQVRTYVAIEFTSEVGKRAFINKISGKCDQRTKRTSAKFPDNVTGDQLRFHWMNVPTELQVLVKAKLPFAGWIETGRLYSPKDRKTRCDREYSVDIKQVRTSTSMACVTPPLKTFAWDIEAKINDMSSPGTHEDDEVYMISISVSDNTDHLILIAPDGCGEAMKRLMGAGDELTVHVCPNEVSLLLEFNKVCRSIGAVARMGWNVNRFDCVVLMARANRLNCSTTLLDLGLALDVPGCVSTTAGRTFGRFSPNDAIYFDTHGVLCLDVMEMFKSTYTKLPKYSLQYVSQKFLGTTKDPVTLKDLNELHSRLMLDDDHTNTLRAVVSKYCVVDSRLTLQLCQKCAHMTSLTEMARITNTPITMVHYQKQQRRMFHLMFSECARKGVAMQDDFGRDRRLTMLDEDSTDGSSNVDNKRQLNYSGAYVKDPEPGLYNMVGSLDVNSMYPTLMIAYNLCYSTVIDDDAHSDYTEENFEIVEWEDHVGCEHDPNIEEREKLKSIFEDLAKVEKRKCIGVQPITKYFKPTSTTRKPVDDVEEYSECNGFTDDNYNDSPVSSIKLSSVDLQRAAIRLKVLKSRMSGGSKLCAKQRVRILKTRRGLLPDLVEYFLEARRKVRAEMKNVSDPLARDILDKSQLAYKVTANSVYGSTGAVNGKLPCQNVAKVTTALGRKTILQSIDIAQRDRSVSTIYSDTDSMYVQLGDEAGDDPWRFVRELAAHITSKLRKPMVIEAEDDIHAKVLFLGKKCYIGRKLFRDGSVSRELDWHGVITVRRDHSQYVKDVYRKAVHRVFAECTMEQFKLTIFEQALTLMHRRVPYERLTKTSEVRNVGDCCTITLCKKTMSWMLGDYKVPQHSHHDILYNTKRDALKTYYVSKLPAPARLSVSLVDRGRPAIEGGRIEFLNIRTSNPDDLPIEEISYFKEHGGIVDRLYYIKQIINPLTKVSEAVWKRSDTVIGAVMPILNYDKVVRQLDAMFN